MIIDFRVRPPFKGFEKLSLFGKTKAFQEYPFYTSKTRTIDSALEHSMEKFFEEMAEAGIAKGVVLPRNSTTIWGGVSNDVVMAGVNEYPDKLIGFGAIDLSIGITKAVAEVTRCIEKLGCKGIVVESGFCNPPLKPDYPQMYPIYAECDRLGVPIVLTMSMLAGPDISFANPVAVQKAAHDFPELQFIIAHAAYPYTKEAISICTITNNVWLLPDLYMNVETVVGREEFSKAITMTHGQRMLFGSAYPFRDMRQSVDDVKEYNLPADYYEDFMYKNAMKLLGLHA